MFFPICLIKVSNQDKPESDLSAQSACLMVPVQSSSNGLGERPPSKKKSTALLERYVMSAYVNQDKYVTCIFNRDAARLADVHTDDARGPMVSQVVCDLCRPDVVESQPIN